MFKAFAINLCAFCILTLLVGCASQPKQLSITDTFLLSKELTKKAIKENAPSKEVADQADYGQLPTNYQEIIKDRYSRTLFDPYSAVFTFDTPQKGWRVLVDQTSVDEQIRLVNKILEAQYNDPNFKFSGQLHGLRAKVLYGWICRGTVNAKNRYGAYVGAQGFEFTLSHGNIYETDLSMTP